MSRKLIEGYLNILTDLLLSYHLTVFTKRAKRQLIAHDKFYYFNTGIYSSLRTTRVLDHINAINGPGFEGLVLQYLRAWNDYQGSPIVSIIGEPNMDLRLMLLSAALLYFMPLKSSMPL